MIKPKARARSRSQDHDRPSAGGAASPHHVLLVGNYRPSLHLARVLAQDGHVVYCGVDDPNPYLFKSKAVKECFSHSSIEHEPDIALSEIERYLQARPWMDVLIPVSDPAARLLSTFRARFEGPMRLALPSRETVDLCADKTASFALCERIGVPIAPRRTVTDREALIGAVAEVGRPCVIKPVDSSNALFGEKAIIMRDGDDLARRLPHWPDEHASLCVQRFVGGERHEIHFAAHRGRLLGAVDCVVVRTDRADGTGYTTELVSVPPIPALARGLEALLRALAYTGVGNVEFIVDGRTDELTFLELDPRLSSSTKIAELCGTPIARWMLELATGPGPVGHPDPWAYTIGRRLVWTKGDISGWLKRLKDGGEARLAAWSRLPRLARAALNSDHATFDLKDPWPTIWIYLHGPLHRLTVEDRAGEKTGARFWLKRLAAGAVRRRVIPFDGKPIIPERGPPAGAVHKTAGAACEPGL